MTNNKIQDTDTTIQKKAPDSNVVSVVLNAAKKVAAIGCIYCFGYLHWSIGWLVAPAIFLIIKDQWKKDADMRRDIAKGAALYNERDVVLARLCDLPAWVFFPDVERVEWLNKIIHQVWPSLNNYTRELIRDTIQPIIKSSLETYKLRGFKFERIILGSIPLRIGGIKVYDKNVARNEIIMDLDIFYAGDCDITFYLTGIKGGIKDFQLKGTLRVVMKPLISSIPLVGGLQVFFLNNPEIDFNLIGIADLLDTPGLGDLLRKIIIQIIASMMVLPNKFPIKLSEEVEAMELKAPEPQGVLRVHVVEAKHLMKKDFGVLGKGKSDPYAILTVGAQEFKTPVISNSLDPKWDYWCEFHILEPEGQELHIHLWDQDDALDDENLGRATVDISNIVEKEQADMWVTLEKAKHGMVHLRFTWLSLSKNYSDLTLALKEKDLLSDAPVSSALITVFIDSAINLPLARTSSQPDPYAVLKVGQVIQQTEVKMRVSNPVWEQGFIFLVANPNTDILILKIVDKKTSQDLGLLNFSIKSLLNKNEMEINKEPFRLTKSGADSRITWSLHLRILKQNSTDGLDDSVSETSSNRGNSVSSGRGILEKQYSSISLRSNSSQQIGLDDSGEGTKESIEDSSVFLESTAPIDDNAGEKLLIHRTNSQSSSAGEAGLGRLQMTLRYSTQRQKLIVVIHKIVNIPLKDPSSIPDPYVKLYLLPERAKETKKKTQTMKDNCNPLFDESFEYLISQSELMYKKLEITICTQKQLFYTSSNILGQIVIDLSKLDINQPFSSWYDLQAEHENGHSKEN